MYSKKCSFVFIFILLFFSELLFCQTSGKIFAKPEADKLFGPVLTSTKVNTADLKNMMNQVKDYILFRFVNGSVEFAGTNRVSLTNDKIIYDEKTVFKYVSISILDELILKGGMEASYFEIRQDVVSITNGEITLERILECPPYCIN